jgi:hypothetical protein
VVYVAWDESATVDARTEGPWSDLVVLRPGLLLIATEAERSELYHGLKHLLPPETPLMVAPLADDPKMSRLAAGSTAWVRGLSRRG